MEKENKQLIFSARGDKLYAVVDNDDNLQGFVTNCPFKEIYAALMLRSIFSKDYQEQNFCHMVLTLLEILPLREDL